MSVVHRNAPPRRRGAGVWRLLALSPDEACFGRRGFATGPARSRLETVGRTFIAGYNRALACPSAAVGEIAPRPAALRGFMAEGAAMGAAVRTALRPWRDDIAPLLDRLAPEFVHLSHVGVGWAMARLPFARRRLARRLDPVLAPLASDGRGFHDGYFHPAAVLRRAPPLHDPVAAAAYDQGVGRSLWFSRCADPGLIGDAVASAGRHRAGDLWAGIGLACAYAGGAGDAALAELRAAAGTERFWLAQGAAFAVAAHARAGALPAHAAAAAACFCAVPPAALPGLVERCREEAVARRGAAAAAYPLWRRTIAEALAQEERR